MADHQEPRFHNCPIPLKIDIPHEHPKTPSNPVVRGLLLYYAARIISYLPFLKYYLFRNAGFADIRLLPYLTAVEPRYDPTVIPIAPPASSTSASETQPPRETSPDTPNRFHTINDYHNAYKTGTTTPTELITSLLPLIRRDVPSPTPHATAWLQLRIDLILAAAEASTARYAANTPLSPLDGVPIAIKDQIDIASYRKTLGSAHDFAVSGTETSWCVKQWEQAGAVILGKLNMHELGLDTTNNNPVHGTPRNPYHADYYTGGSSGGSGYAVAAGLVPVALGADGGGSIRVPAAFCGVFGLKTSHGRVSARPTVSIASTTSVIGPLAANMADLELAYRVMATPDSLHASSSLFPAPSQISSTSSKKKYLGICKPWFDRADPPVLNACYAALDYLTSQHDYTLVPITLPHVPSAQLAHALTILSEISAAHPSVERFTTANQLLMSVGSCASAADFLAAQRLRHVIMRHLAALFKEFPGLVVVSPVTPNVGVRVGGSGGGSGASSIEAEFTYGISDGNTAVRTMEYVWLANFSGCPALAAPVGYWDPSPSQGVSTGDNPGSGDEGGGGVLPISLMGLSEWGDESTLLSFGYDLETYINKEVGRRRPGCWVDVLGLAKG